MPDTQAARPTSFERINEFKHNFGPSYNRSWPHLYYREHLALDYQIPERARPTFGALLDAYEIVRGRAARTVLDLGCSYGVNAALLKYVTGLDRLYVAYTMKDGELAGRNIEAHARFLAGLPVRRGLRVIGIDPAERAVDYGIRAGLLDDGIVCDLEIGEVPMLHRHQLEAVDLVISTGCVGYITARTFGALCRALPESARPWIASYVMHPFTYDAIKSELDTHGFSTERLSGHQHRQRRFSSATEWRAILRAMGRERMDSRFEKATGYIHADCYLSVPQAETDVVGQLTAPDGR